MKKTIIFSFFFLLFFQFSFSQNLVNLKYDEAVQAYKNKNFESAVSKIKEIKPLYTKVPPKVSYLEIMAKNEILKSDLANDFAMIDGLRKLTAYYLKVNVNRKNDNYTNIKYVSLELNNYPKDIATFLEIKQAKVTEELARKRRDEEATTKAAEYEKAQVIIRESTRIQDSINNEKDKIEKDKNRLIKEKLDKEKIKQDEINQLAAYKSQEKINKRNGRSFSNIGFQSGEIAKYGLLFEHGGQRSIIGFRMAGRTSLTPDEDILNGTSRENKMEVEIGPNFRLLKRLYLNFGLGYGFYKYLNHDDYLGSSSLDKKAYIATSAGMMIRIARVVNFNVGASFMDIHKEFYTPEITFGLSFNLKGSK